MRISTLGSTDSFAAHLLDQLTPRSGLEPDAIFSEATALIFSQFAALLSWLFALSEAQDTIHKRRSNICIFQTGVFLVACRSYALQLIVLKF
jgi:hypothetical protein